MMNRPPKHPASRTGTEGSVLILVIWIIFGLVAITLYFGQTMTFELRASDNRYSGIEAEQAIEAARRYLSLVLSNDTAPGNLLIAGNFQREAVPVGNAHFWLIGRTNTDNAPASVMCWGLVDEASKLNINNATSNMLIWLPRMTPALLNSIITWRSSATNATAISTGGAESDTYLRLQPPYNAKNSTYETVGELRMIYNMDMLTLVGEDSNLNGILDPNENDGETLPPSDNHDGKLDPGLMEYLTVYSHEPTTMTNGTALLNVAAPTEALRTNMAALFGQQQADAFLTQARMLRGGQIQAVPAITCPLAFYKATGMAQNQFAQLEPYLRGSRTAGLVNVNTASTTVLTCLLSGDSATAQQITSYRAANANNQYNSNSVAWVANVVTDLNLLVQIGTNITGRAYQYTADIAALGHNGRGYRRTKFVFDTVPLVGTNAMPPSIVYRQDLTDLGWALGKQVRDRWVLGNKIP